MAKRIAFLGENGGTYEVVPVNGNYPGDAVTISESTKQSEDMALFEKIDISDTFDESGICQIYKSCIFVRNIIFDPVVFRTFLPGPGLKTASNGALEVQVDDSTIEVSADIVQVKDGGITTTKTDFAGEY